MVVILLVIISIINNTKEKFLENYKKIIFLLFSTIPILIWKVACINYDIKNIIVNYNIFNLTLLINKIFDYNSLILIFKYFFLDIKFSLSLIFILVAFNFTKDKKILYFSLSVGMAYLFSLIIVFLIAPYDLAWALQTTVSRVIMSVTFLFTFFGLLQIYYKKTKKYVL